jgi:DNA-binding LacI/PurR family transcriptional regulator
MENLYRAETQSLVKKTALEMDYQPNRGARAMRSQKNKLVGFVAKSFEQGKIENYTLYPFLIGLTQELKRADYHVTLVDLTEIKTKEASDIPKILREHFFDALIVHYAAPENLSHWANTLKIPVIWWDSGKPLPHAHLYRDEKKVGTELTNQLLELGHQKIAFMSSKNSWEKYSRGEVLHYSYAARYESYAAAMKAKKMDTQVVTGYAVQDLAEQLKHFESTAVIIHGEIPVPLLLAAQKLDLKIPQDLSIASFDVEEKIIKSDYPIGGITYDRTEAGVQAGRLVLEAIQHPTLTTPSYSYTGTFQMGESIASPRKHA